MARQVRSRRFQEPRCGVSKIMIECEAKELGREMESYLLLSHADLKQTGEQRLRMYRQANESLQAIVDNLPEREQQAVIAMLGRDLDLTLELYLEFLRSLHPKPVARLCDPPAPPLPFSEWLFGS